MVELWLWKITCRVLVAHTVVLQIKKHYIQLDRARTEPQTTRSNSDMLTTRSFSDSTMVCRTCSCQERRCGQEGGSVHSAPASGGHERGSACGGRDGREAGDWSRIYDSVGGTFDPLLPRFSHWQQVVCPKWCFRRRKTATTKESREFTAHLWWA